MTNSCGSQNWCGRWSWNKFPTNSGLISRMISNSQENIKSCIMTLGGLKVPHTVEELLWGSTTGRSWESLLNVHEINYSGNWELCLIGTSYLKQNIPIKRCRLYRISSFLEQGRRYDLMSGRLWHCSLGVTRGVVLKFLVGERI